MRIASTLTKVGVLLSFFISSTGFSATISPSLEEAIQEATPNDNLSVIIKFVDKVNFKNYRSRNKNLPRKRYRRNLLKNIHDQFSITSKPVLRLLKANKLKKIVQLKISNRISADIPAKLISVIANNPNVESISLISYYQLATPLPAAATTPEWNLDSVGVKKLWSLGYRGQGIVVANIDSGVDLSHPDLQAKYRGGNNSWFDAFGLYSSPADLFGHGTQTMGVMVGGNASGENIGMAPEAQWIAARIFNAQGDPAPQTNIHLAFDWLSNPDGNIDTDDLPDVVNASWGDRTNINKCIPDFEEDIAALKALGVAVVFAAGNEGPGLSTSVSPANNPSGYAVGATTEAGYVASFSSRGPSPLPPDDCVINSVPVPTTFPNVVAPGNMIKLAKTTLGTGAANSYINVSGTSFAAPHVAGLMALLKNAMPNVSVAELESVLEQTATDIDLPGFDDNTGWGLVDGVAAFFQLPIDTDGDLILDKIDNCIMQANPDQTDFDNDGFGNRCDADFNNDLFVNGIDLNIFISNYFSSDPLTDLNSDNFVNGLDLNIFIQQYFSAPGPSGYNF